MANTNLSAAKRAKQDEFYTQWIDIEREMNAYIEYDPDVFRGKTVLLPCDDPSWSNFAKFFALHFTEYGMKKLIATSYAPKANADGIFYRLEDEVKESPNYDPEKDLTHGKIFVLDGNDINDDGRVDYEDLRWDYLEGDGDFRSEEVTKLRDEADFVVTNPPFSLFREFMAWMIEGGVKFSIIGNMNAITYREIFPLIKADRLWLGAQGLKTMSFSIPDNAPEKTGQIVVDGVRQQTLGNACWFTNIEHGRRHDPMSLMSTKDNIKYNKRLRKTLDAAGVREYQKYDNYDAIEVPVVDAIPKDYAGVMGVPITFLGRYCPEQFEIVGSTGSNDPNNAFRTRVYSSQECKDAYFARFGKPGVYDLNASGVINGAKVYSRILIRHLNPDPTK